MEVPKLRFKADDGSDFPNWEEKTLGELCEPLTYGMNAAATKFDGENRYIRITDIDDETHAFWYRQESCALFRQPHKPAVRCGYPSSRVTSR